LLLVAIVACGSSHDVATAHDPPPVSVAPPAGPAASVDPFIGTGDANVAQAVINGQGGSTFPGAAMPFGMVQWSPDTPQAAPPGYYYPDTSITAFSLTHLNGAGCPAERDFPIMPFAEKPDFSSPWQVGFSHADEHASPGFYEVKLTSGIVVDLTATARTGLARFTFPDGSDPYIALSGGPANEVLDILDFDAHIDPGAQLVTGSRNERFCILGSPYRVYFALRFDRAFADSGTVTQGDASAGAVDAKGQDAGVYFHFSTDDTHVVHMKVGLSYVSVEGAKAALDAENPGWDFDAVHAAAVAKWNDYLGRVAIEGGSPEEQRMFYTALYHSFLQPGVVSDVDGTFVGFDHQTHRDTAHPRYAGFSGWDVYRSWIQLVSVLAPKEASDFVRSLVASGQECGVLPQWSIANTSPNTMVGDPADPTIAAAWAFGARDFDAAAALALMEKGATDATARCDGNLARPGLADYVARGFCPVDASDGPRGPTSTTLEYAVADFAIASFAKTALGDDATWKAYSARSQSWRNVFDTSMRYVQPRHRNDVGGQPSFQSTPPESDDGFVEGNPAQYTFFVPHDFPGLITDLGGDAAAIARLDALFGELNAGLGRPGFYMGNEPGFSTPWAYVFAGAPHRTQAVVRRLLRETFAPTPSGLPGNDDLGAMSSWQAWAMLGLYPAIPGDGVLVVGSPTFPKATVTLGSGAKLVLAATGASPDAPYVQNATIGGQPLGRAYLRWDELANGADLEFTVGASPNESWASTDRPPSAL
jgi:predicted alpha-1,2-mannosidase